MESLHDLALSIHGNPNLTTRAKVELLNYVSDLCKLSTNIMEKQEIKMLDTFLSNLISPPKHITAYLLSAHYLLEPKTEALGTVVFNVTRVLPETKFFDVSYTSAIATMASNIAMAHFTLICRIRDPYHIGEVSWYDPFSTEMSVRWNDENEGYTVRDMDTTKRMFDMMKRIGESK